MSDSQLRELLGLLKGADSVELKLTVPEAEHRAVARALGTDPLKTRAFLAERGVDTSGEQETKTRKALEFYVGAGC